MTFELQHTDNASDARTGIITTDHGQIKTPIFMPVGTVGSVKGVHFEELRKQVKHSDTERGCCYGSYPHRPPFVYGCNGQG